tara:strand:- start:3485 stop:3937 length:453 start_codon:yes stop_codon:yes gene_type:complete
MIYKETNNKESYKMLSPLKPEQYNILWRSSWLSFFSTLYAIKNKKYFLAIGPASIFLTSLNYWKKPKEDDWELYLDTITVRSVFLYQLYLSLYTKQRNQYLIASAMVSSIYFMESYFYKESRFWIYTYCHMGIHIVGNIGSCILYGSEKI